MNVFKLDTIVPDSNRDKGLSGLKSEILERERAASYAKGFQDGVKVTSEALEAEKIRVLSVIAEAISDVHITHEQASAAVLKSLVPTIEAVIGSVTPQIMHDRLVAEISETIANAYRKCRNTKVHIEVSSALIDEVQALCATSGLDISLETNPELHDLEARVHWDDGADTFDLATTKDEITALISDFSASLNEGTDDQSRTG